MVARWHNRVIGIHVAAINQRCVLAFEACRNGAMSMNSASWVTSRLPLTAQQLPCSNDKSVFGPRRLLAQCTIYNLPKHLQTFARTLVGVQRTLTPFRSWTGNFLAGPHYRRALLKFTAYQEQAYD
jgi:hypothetical protein